MNNNDQSNFVINLNSARSRSLEWEFTSDSFKRVPVLVEVEVGSFHPIP